VFREMVRRPTDIARGKFFHGNEPQGFREPVPYGSWIENEVSHNFMRLAYNPV